MSLPAPHAHTHIQLFARIIINEPLCQDQRALFLKGWEKQKAHIVLKCFYVKTLLLKLGYILLPAQFFLFQVKLLVPLPDEISSIIAKCLIYIWGRTDDILRLFLLIWFSSYFILQWVNDYWLLNLTCLAFLENSCRFWQLVNTGFNPSSATYKLCAIWQVS